MALSGFSSSEAEGLRRAMSRKRSEEAIAEHHRRFLAGAAANGVSEETAERVWDQIKGFSGFGFPKAHSAAFGLLAYQSAWLRIHYGPEFLCSLLNEQPMGFYPPDSLVHEAQRRGIRVAAARRQPQPGPLPRRIAARRRGRARRAGGAGRPRLRQGREEGGDGGAGRRARARRPLRGDRRTRLALRRRPAEPRTPRLGRRPRRHPGRLGGRAPRGPLAGRRHRAGRLPAAAPSWRCRWSRRDRPSWSRWGSGGS